MPSGLKSGMFGSYSTWARGTTLTMLSRSNWFVGLLVALHDQHVLEALVVGGAVLGRAVAHAVELEALQRLDDFRRIEGAGRLDRVGVEQGLHVAGLRGLRGRCAVLGAERLGQRLGGVVGQLPVPVGGAEDALDGVAGARRHQLGDERHDDLELLAVDHLVAQAELGRLGQRVDHVEAVMVQDQHVGAGIQDRRDVLREVRRADLGQHGRDGLPAELLGGVLHRLLLGPAPGVVAGQVIGLAVLAVLLGEHRPERLAGHVGVEEMAEAITATVLAGGVVRVGQAAHEDDAGVLAERLHGHGDARRRAAGDHDGAVLLDHLLGGRARGVGLGLRCRR